MRELSILIPARNEEFLERTIEDIFSHIEGKTEVLVALDNWPDAPDIKGRPHLKVIRTKLGQRGATNALARLSEAKYVMKLDAHVTLSPGFDLAMMEDMQDDVTLVPALMNFRPYEWVCVNKHRRYQNKKPAQCDQCEETDLAKDIIWQIVPKPFMTDFYLDTDLIFQYCLQQSPTLLNETMAIQGSGFMMTRDKYWELDICGEEFGSWGQQGAEVALKTWLSGGKVLATKKAFMGHWFRQMDEFPYQRDMDQVAHANTHCKELFLTNSWPKQKRSLQSLVRQFNYPGDWSEPRLAELVSPLNKLGVV